MGGDLRWVRVAVAALVTAWIVAGVLVFVHVGVLASVVGVGWGGSMLVCAAASLERAVSTAVHRQRESHVITLDEPAAA